MKRILLLLCALTALPALADDTGLWLGAEAQKSINKKFSVDAGLGFRAEDHVRQASRWDVSVGASYKPFSFLTIGAGYVFLRDYSPEEVKEDYKKSDPTEFNGYNVDHAYWRSKHRAVLDLTGKVSAGRFTFSLRERYQYTHYMAATTTRDRYRDILSGGMSPEDWTGNLYPYEGINFTSLESVSRDKSAKDRHYLRSRVQAEYNIRHCPWTPYASYEFSNNIGENFHLDKMRLTVGAEWKITKQHRLDVAYVYDNGADDDTNNDMHALSLGYKFKF